MSEHTPGPWEVWSGNPWQVFAPRESNGLDGQYHIAGANHNNPNGKANGRLIAAAPDLLEALKEMRERLQVHMKHTEDLMADMKAAKAIEKAEGVTDGPR